MDMIRSRLSGSPLTAADLSRLANSGISSAMAEQALLRRVNSAEGAAFVGRNGSTDCAGVIFPYIWPGQEVIREYRLRRDNPECEITADGARKEVAKYISPPGRGNLLYFVPGTAPAWLSDSTMPVIITEGEKKTIALWTAASHGGAADPRFLPIGISGVWNWRGTVGKQTGPDGGRQSIKGAIPDLARVAWRRRKVTICFDTNVCNDDSVQAARREFTKELHKRGARVFWFRWPADTPANVNGIDDLLGLWGPDRVLSALEAAEPWKAQSAAVRVWTLTELRAADFRPAEPIVEDVLAEGETIAIVGRPKVGKSRLVQQLAVDLSRNRTFLGHAVSRPRRVLLLDLENRPTGARARFARMSQVGPGDYNIMIYAPETLAGSSVSLATAEGVRTLKALVTECAPDVLIVDTWRLLLGGDENKTEVVVKGLKALSEVRRKLPALGIILVHHVRKQHGDSPARLRTDPARWIENASGHYSFIGHVDGCFGLEREVDPKTGAEDLIVFGGIARNAAPRILLIEEDPETLRFNVVQSQGALSRILTGAESAIWKTIAGLDEFTFSGALERSTTKNRKALASVLKKAQAAGLISQQSDKSYRATAQNGTTELGPSCQ